MIKKELPPNIENIRLAGFGTDPEGIYAYAPDVFSLSKKEIPADIQYHEDIHIQRQGDSPLLWWHKWLTDKDFRLEEELEAYARQAQWVKKNLGSKAAKEGLDEFAENLSSSMYKLNINFHKAHAMIRRKIQDDKKI